MLDSIMSRTRLLARRGSWSEMRFEAGDHGRRAWHETGLYAVVADGRGRHSAIRHDPATRGVGLILASRSEAACEDACKETSALKAEGHHLFHADVALPGAGDLTRCVVAVTRSRDAGLVFRLPCQPGATFVVKPAYLPNFLEGTHRRADFFDARQSRSSIRSVSTLLLACMEAPGLMRIGEINQAKWGSARLRLWEASATEPRGDAMPGEARELELVRDAVRLTRLGADLPEHVAERIREAARALHDNATAWSALSSLPVASDIDAILQEAPACGVSP